MLMTRRALERIIKIIPALNSHCFNGLSGNVLMMKVVKAIMVGLGGSIESMCVRKYTCVVKDPDVCCLLLTAA